MYLHELIQRRFSLLGLNSYTAEVRSRQLAEQEGAPGLEVSKSSWDRLSNAPADERDWITTIGGTSSPLANFPQIRMIFATARTLDLDPLAVGTCAIRSALGIPEANPGAAAAHLLFPGWDALPQALYAEWIRYGRALRERHELEERVRDLEAEHVRLRGAPTTDGSDA